MRGFSYKPYAELKNAEYKGISLEKDQETGNYTDTPNYINTPNNFYNSSGSVLKTEEPNKFAFDPVASLSTPSTNMIEKGLQNVLDSKDDGFGQKDEQKGWAKANEKLFGFKDDGSSLGSKAMGASGEILQTGFQTFANFKNVSQSSEERTAQIMQGAAAGGQIGFALGGPIGGIAGAAVVGGINALDAASDKRKNIETADIEAKQEFEKKKNERLKRFNAGNSLLGFNQTKVV